MSDTQQSGDRILHQDAVEEVIDARVEAFMAELPPSVESSRPTIPAWATGTEYVADQPVKNGGHTYTANDAHTAGATFAGDLVAHWTLLPIAVADVVGAAPTASPVLTGNPTAPTPAPGDNDTSIATSAFVKAAIDALIAGAPGALDTLNEIAAQLATDESAVSALTTTVAGKAAKASNLSDLANAATARTNLGLGSVDNTADTAKPVSTAQAAADAVVAASVTTEATTRAAADAVLALPIAAGVRGDGWIPASSRQNRRYAAASNGTHTDQNSMYGFLADADGQSVVVRYDNFEGANAITIVAASISLDAALTGVAPLFFANGTGTITIAPGAYVDTLPIGWKITKNVSKPYIRTHVVVSSGQTWKINYANLETGEALDTSATDKTITGTISGGGSGGSSFGYGPSMILTRPATRIPSVCFAGDSQINSNESTAGTGWWRTLCAGRVSACQAGLGGDTVVGFTNDGPATGALYSMYARHRKASMAGANNHVFNWGTNDLFLQNVTATAHMAAILAIATQYANRGGRVFWLTTTPRTTSSDSFATVGNQTTVNAPAEAYRVTFNTWLRAGAPIDPATKAAVAVGTGGALLAGSAGHPLVGYFDQAAAVESSLNSGKWAAGMTTDGIHQNATGDAAIGAAHNYALFV